MQNTKVIAVDMKKSNMNNTILTPTISKSKSVPTTPRSSTRKTSVSSLSQKDLVPPLLNLNSLVNQVIQNNQSTMMASARSHVSTMSQKSHNSTIYRSIEADVERLEREHENKELKVLTHRVDEERRAILKRLELEEKKRLLEAKNEKVLQMHQQRANQAKVKNDIQFSKAIEKCKTLIEQKKISQQQFIQQVEQKTSAGEERRKSLLESIKKRAEMKQESIREAQERERVNNEQRQLYLSMKTEQEESRFLTQKQKIEEKQQQIIQLKSQHKELTINMAKEKKDRLYQGKLEKAKLLVEKEQQSAQRVLSELQRLRSSEIAQKHQKEVQKKELLEKKAANKAYENQLAQLKIQQEHEREVAKQMEQQRNAKLKQEYQLQLQNQKRKLNDFLSKIKDGKIPNQKSYEMLTESLTSLMHSPKRA